jgi:hypothetical protein
MSFTESSLEPPNRGRCQQSLGYEEDSPSWREDKPVPVQSDQPVYPRFHQVVMCIFPRYSVAPSRVGTVYIFQYLLRTRRGVRVTVKVEGVGVMKDEETLKL